MRVVPRTLVQAHPSASVPSPFARQTGATTTSPVPEEKTLQAPNDPRWGDVDRHLFNEGRHWRLWRHLGAHLASPGDDGDSGSGVWFAVWAPDASAVSVVGDWNGFTAGADPLSAVGSTGVWSGYSGEAREGHCYKYAVTARSGEVMHKADPLALATEHPPKTASVVTQSRHIWLDERWIERSRTANPWRERLSIYEVHLGSWRNVGGYVEMARALAPYAKELGFTHLELMPVAEHPFGGSWGYQVSSYFAPTSRYGSPDDFRAFVDICHQHDLGVLLDWVPAHFPKDDWSLGRFDGTALYEHLDPRLGEHPDWGTFVFNYGRHEVRNFLTANALYWLEEFHIDGLRVDAVASMLYLDYSRRDGEWIPNRHGGRENLDAIQFLREANTIVHAEHPGVLMIAEESTAWPAVSRPVHAGGLGFGFKWNMGWMHDTLRYFSFDPVYRQHHHQDLTFGLLYAFTESFVLPLSHDEVVHGKKALLAKMPGDEWQQRANMRALLAWMWAHPGKQLLFMGAELGEWREWAHDRELNWGLLEDARHAGLWNLVRDLNAVQARHPALYERDGEPEGFGWVVVDDDGANVYAFARWAVSPAPPVVCIANLSPVVRSGYTVTLPRGGGWLEILNTDSSEYAGGGVGNGGWIGADGLGRAELTLPPLGVLWLAHDS